MSNPVSTREANGHVDADEEPSSDADALQIGDLTLSSRLILGSSNYPNPQVMLDALEAAGTELVTVAIRRVNVQNPAPESHLDLIRRGGYHVLPNTAGCYTAREAVLVAQLAKPSAPTSSSWR